MNQRFQNFLTGITVCYKYIQRIKNAEMTEFGLKGSHVACIFYLNHYPGGLTSAQLCSLCAEDKASISRTVAFLRSTTMAATATSTAVDTRGGMWKVLSMAEVTE